MSLKCFYHPEREAATKCEKCGKVICVECKMVYHKTVHRGTGDDRYAYSERYEYCPVCYYDTEIKKYKNYSYGCIGVMIVFIIAAIFMFFPTGLYTPMMFVVGILLSLGIFISIIAFFYLRFVYSPKKTAEFNAKKEEFLQSIKTPTSIKEEEITAKFCPECGTRVEPDYSVCSYCGFIIKE